MITFLISEAKKEPTHPESYDSNSDNECLCFEYASNDPTSLSQILQLSQYKHRSYHSDHNKASH
jgi:hypothetical protein